MAEVGHTDESLQFERFYLDISPPEMQQMQQWFAAVDMDRSGTITAHELQNMAFGGLRLGYDTALKLVKVFDRDKNMSIGTLFSLSRLCC